jgi:hypothetical protein
MTTYYVRNRHEAAIVAHIARELGARTSVRDIYQYDRYLINIASRLFGPRPEHVTFVQRAHAAIRCHRDGEAAI